MALFRPFKEDRLALPHLDEVDLLYAAELRTRPVAPSSAGCWLRAISRVRGGGGGVVCS